MGEMERLSLQRENDSASVERLAKLEKELADFKEEQATLNGQWQAEKEVIDQIQSLKEGIDQVTVEIQQAQRDYDYNRAAELQYGKLTDLQQQITNLEAQLEEQQTSGSTLLREEVLETDIAEIIAKWTGIPISKLVESEK